MRYPAQPYAFDRRGRTAERDRSGHIRDLIEAVLFTAPGERVNRPSFGAGASRLLFEPNSPEAAAASQFLVQSGLQQFLAGLIEVREVAVSNDDARLRIRVEYVELESGAAGSTEVELEGR